jgi:hypothetical protein
MGSHAEPISARRRIKAKGVPNPGVYAVGCNDERASSFLPVHLQTDHAPSLKNRGLHDGSGMRANLRCGRCGLEQDRVNVFPPLATSASGNPGVLGK